ncbi:MAG: alpha/beta hydrolase [Longimicrobiales bacterium]
MLDFLETVPASARNGSPLLVLLHGRGSHMGDLQGLAGILPPHASLVTPQAPHPGAPWGYGPGWAWYRYLGDDRADPLSIKASLGALEAFLEDLPGAIEFEPGPLVLGGFSQGGTTSLAYALTHPGAVDGVVNLSGFLVNLESLDLGPAALGDTPVFWAHGTRDPAVPFSLALRGRARLQAAGVRMEARDYHMGHWVSPEEMEDLDRWLRREIPGWEASGA